MRDRERHLLLSLEIIGGRTAFEVHGAVRDQRDTRRRSDRVELGFERGEFERAFHPIDDARAQIHGIAYHLLLIVVVGKRHRGLAVAESDGARILDLLERAGELLAKSWTGEEERTRDHRKQHFAIHWRSLLVN